MQHSHKSEAVGGLFSTGRYEKKGEFTIRSTYHMAKDKLEGNGGSCSNREASTHLGKKVWTMGCSNVVKYFLWKACNNSLPTKANLYKREIIDNQLCLICGLEPETVCHAFFLI